MYAHYACGSGPFVLTLGYLHRGNVDVGVGVGVDVDVDDGVDGNLSSAKLPLLKHDTHGSPPYGHNINEASSFVHSFGH